MYKCIFFSRIKASIHRTNHIKNHQTVPLRSQSIRWNERYSIFVLFPTVENNSWKIISWNIVLESIGSKRKHNLIDASTQIRNEYFEHAVWKRWKYCCRSRDFRKTYCTNDCGRVHAKTLGTEPNLHWSQTTRFLRFFESIIQRHWRNAAQQSHSVHQEYWCDIIRKWRPGNTQPWRASHARFGMGLLQRRMQRSSVESTNIYADLAPFQRSSSRILSLLRWCKYLFDATKQSRLAFSQSDFSNYFILFFPFLGNV